MQGAARFYLDMLQTDSKTGWLVNNPSTSFENEFRKEDGSKGWAYKGSTQDLQIIRDLFTNCIEAEKILNVNKPFQDSLLFALQRLAPMQIKPATARLQEWLRPWEPFDLKSAQTPHGWGLAPGNQITPENTPELANAIRKVLEYQKPWEMLNCGSWIGGHLDPSASRSYTLSNKKSKTSVEVISDVDPGPFYIIMFRHSFSVEPMVLFEIKPGESFTWNRTYKFNSHH